MESYMEPCGDVQSWGFRPGRGCGHAVTQLNHLLTYMSNSENKFKNKMELSLGKAKAKYKERLEQINDTVLQNDNTSEPSFIEIKRNREGQRSITNKVDIKYLTAKARKLLLNPTDKNPKHYFETKYIFDADIKGCFDNISHTWLMNNTPIPSIYSTLLTSMLKTNIFEVTPKKKIEDPFSGKKINNPLLNPLINKAYGATWPSIEAESYSIYPGWNSYTLVTSSKDNNKGVPQGGIISPLLMNWTLDGLSTIARNSAMITANGTLKPTYLSEEKKDWFEAQNQINGTNKKATGTPTMSATHLVRYADDFIITTLGKEPMTNAIRGVKTFLAERGLEINEDKSQIIKWTMGKKLNFLGWTFHLLQPYHINWLTDIAKSLSNRLNDRIKVYVYPSSQSTKKFRDNIKTVTSSNNIHITPTELIKEFLNPLIYGWSNYFIPSPNQYELRKSLDHFVFTRCMKWIYKKYGGKTYATMIRILLKSETGRDTNGKETSWNRTMTVTDKENKTALKTVSLAQKNAPEPWMLYRPSKNLANTSFILEPEPYVNRALRLGALKGDIRSTLMTNQENKCIVCEQPLIDFNNMEKLSRDFNDFSDFSEYINNEGIWDLDKNITTLDSHQNKDQPGKTISLLSKYKGSRWSAGIQTDHLIPKNING